MNSFFDYIYIRIFNFYNSFKNEPSEFSGKLLVTFLQTSLLLDILSLASLFIEIPALFFKLFFGVSAILIFIRLNRRYSNIELFNDLRSKWKHESKGISIIKGVLIACLYILSIVFCLSVGNFIQWDDLECLTIADMNMLQSILKCLLI